MRVAIFLPALALGSIIQTSHHEKRVPAIVADTLNRFHAYLVPRTPDDEQVVEDDGDGHEDDDSGGSDPDESSADDSDTDSGTQDDLSSGSTDQDNSPDQLLGAPSVDFEATVANAGSADQENLSDQSSNAASEDLSVSQSLTDADESAGTENAQNPSGTDTTESSAAAESTDTSDASSKASDSSTPSDDASEITHQDTKMLKQNKSIFNLFGFGGFGRGSGAGSSSPAASASSNGNNWLNWNQPIGKRPGLTASLLPNATKTASMSAYGAFTQPIVPSLSTTKPGQQRPSATSLTSIVPQQTNGPSSRGNWLPGFTIKTDSYQSWPNTGNTVQYTFRVQNTTLSPEGVPRQMLVINGQYPAPTIQANWGDWIEVTVINELQNNGTGLHFHGMRQLHTNTEDGVNGVTECPIAPGDRKTYRFQATQYGTAWYHSHFSVQYGDGVAGPIIINGPASANYDIDLGAVMLTDWYPQPVFTTDWIAVRSGPQLASNYLMNGQNARPDGSSGKQPRWNFTPGKLHRLRLVNSGLDTVLKVQIDGHIMQVIQTDWVPIVPYYTREISLSVGQRYDVIVAANQTAGNYWFRAMSAKSCCGSSNDGSGSVANGIISYQNSSTSGALPTSTFWTHSNQCVDEPMASLVPFVARDVDSQGFAAAAANSMLHVSGSVVKSANDSIFLWTLGGIANNIDWDNPTLGQSVAGNNTFIPERHVIQLSSPNVWTYWIIQNDFFVPHPFHLHGHDFSLLGQGTGNFDPSTMMSQLQFKNPPRRDVALLLASGWTAIAFETDNPGAWLMHCHIAWHAGEGLSLQFLERPSEIPSMYGSIVNGNSWQSVCKNWKTYDQNATYQKWDSGLRRRDTYLLERAEDHTDGDDNDDDDREDFDLASALEEQYTERSLSGEAAVMRFVKRNEL